MTKENRDLKKILETLQHHEEVISINIQSTLDNSQNAMDAFTAIKTCLKNLTSQQNKVDQSFIKVFDSIHQTLNDLEQKIESNRSLIELILKTK